MTKEDAMKQMAEIVILEGNYEIGHSTADWILCEFLEELGHKDLVDLYDQVGKWYA